MALIGLGKIEATLELDISKFTANAQAAQGQLAQLRGGLVGVGAAGKKHVSTATQALQRMAQTGNRLQTLGNTITSLGRDMTVGLTLPLVALAAGSLTAAIKFQSAFAGIRKTVTASEPEFAHLRKEILDMSEVIPVGANQLALFGELAGQMGVSIKDLPQFIRVIAELGAVSNLAGEEGALMISRFLRVMGMANSEVRKVADVIVDLGNKVAARENEIGIMGLRIAGAGREAGMTAADVLGLSGALVELGIRAEMGGSGISRVIKSMNRAVLAGGQNLQTFASVSGLSIQEFSRLMKEDAAQALLLFLGGLKRMTDEGKSTQPVMDLLKMSTIRVQDVMVRTGLNIGRVAVILGIARGQFEKGGAMATEFGKRMDTTESQIKLAINTLTRLAVTFGEELRPMLLAVLRGAILPLLAVLRVLVQIFSSLPRPIQTLVVGFAALLAVIGPLTAVTGMFIASWGKLLVAFSLIKTLLTTGALVKGFIGLGVLMGPAGAIAAGIAAIASGIGLIWHYGKKMVETFTGPKVHQGVMAGEGYQQSQVALEKQIEEQKALEEMYKKFPFLDPKNQGKSGAAQIPLAKGVELRKRGLEISQAQFDVEKAQQDLSMARLGAKTTEIQMAEAELAQTLARLAREKEINDAQIARAIAAKARVNDPAKAAELNHEASLLRMANDRISLEMQTAEAQADQTIQAQILSDAVQQLNTDMERLDQSASTSADLRSIQNEMAIDQMKRMGASEEEIQKAKMAFQLDELDNTAKLLRQKYSLLETEKALALDASERSRLDTAMQGITGELAVLEERKGQIKQQASEVGTAFGNAFAQGFTDMFMSILEGGDFIGSFSNALQSIGQQLLKPMTEMLTNQLSTALSSLFSGIGSSLGGLAQGAMGLALIGISALFNQQKAEVESLGDQALQGIESIERTRGLIAGEQNVAIAALSQNLGEAFRPTNEILLRVEMILRAMATGTPLSAETNGEISMSSIFSQELLGSARF